MHSRVGGACVPMLPASVEAGATPLIGAGLPAGMAVEGLRLLDGSLVLKLELGATAVQSRLAAGRGFDPGDGMVLRHDLRVARGRKCPSPGRGSGDRELWTAVEELAARRSRL